jgi:hypothetical protein
MAFQFKIQLKYVTDPPVWRRLSVPENFTFLRFHKVIQAAFGWDNYHLFQFSEKGWGSEPRYGMPSNDMFDDGTEDSSKVKLSQVFDHPKQKYVYIYDFGDDWHHQITLEKITPDKITKADLLAGEGACPPEDCGGFPGYEALKAILADPEHPEHENMREWLGLEESDEWDAATFDLEHSKALVQRV